MSRPDKKYWKKFGNMHWRNSNWQNSSEEETAKIGCDVFRQWVNRLTFATLQFYAIIEARLHFSRALVLFSKPKMTINYILYYILCQDILVAISVRRDLTPKAFLTNEAVFIAKKPSVEKLCRFSILRIPINDKIHLKRTRKCFVWQQVSLTYL